MMISDVIYKYNNDFFFEKHRQRYQYKEIMEMFMLYTKRLHSRAQSTEIISGAGIARPNDVALGHTRVYFLTLFL